MSHLIAKTETALKGLILFLVAGVLLAAATAEAAVPGISAAAAPAGITSTSTFNLTAAAAYMTQPDGEQIYSWGYGCAGAATFAPAVFQSVGVCPAAQIPGPTLIVTEGDIVSITLTNSLPAAAGNTSMVFPGFQVCAGTIASTSVTATSPNGTCTAGTVGVGGLLTQEAAPGSSVTYSFVATTPGTRAYYSGTQTDLQVEMGLYGAIVVKPKTPPTNCAAINSDSQLLGHTDYRLAPAAYDHPATCYDREYLFQFMELDSRIHRQAETQVAAIAACNPTTSALPCPATLEVSTEPYHPQYYLINGRSMPDDMDPDYAPNYPNQPYNGNPHMHPGDLVLLRTIGQGRWQHPFHQHGNHVRILARDGNLILSQTDSAKLAGRMEFTTDTYPGQSYDGIFYWSGKGLGWDIYGHTLPKAVANISTATESTNTVTVTTIGALPSQIVPGAQVTVKGVFPDGYNGTFTVVTASTGSGPGTFTYTDTAASNLAPYSIAPVAFLIPFGVGTGQVSVLTSTVDPTPCIPDQNGYDTSNTAATNYYEWCADHNHPLESNPVGDVGSGGPATQFDPLIATNGLWYNGTPYLGPDAVHRNRGTTPLPPGEALQNPPAESGIAFMWHSHNEREITTNDVFPGGMLMMMLVDPPVWFIDETL